MVAVKISINTQKIHTVFYCLSRFYSQIVFKGLLSGIDELAMKRYDTISSSKSEEEKFPFPWANFPHLKLFI